MNELQRLISENQINDALDYLLAAAPDARKYEVVQLIAQYKEMKRNERLGLSTNNELFTARNKLVNSILNFPLENTDIPKGQESKKKVLFICSSPGGQKLDFGSEFKKISVALQLAEYRDRFFKPEIETKVEADEFLNILTRYKPDILHISLHSSKSNGLYFEDIIGNAQQVNTEEFSDIIRIYCSDRDGKKKIETVILCSCNSYGYGKAIKEYADNIIATRDFFPDKAAIVYADQFYKMLFNKKDITYAHESAVLALKRKKYPVQTNFPIHEIPVLIKAGNYDKGY